MPGSIAQPPGRRRGVAARDRLPHGGIGLHVPVALIVHDAEVAAAECLGDGQRDLRLGGDHLGALVLRLRLELLLDRHREGPPLLRLGLGDALVRLGLVRLQLGADVLADVHVGDVDRQDLERRAGVESLGEHRLGDQVGILQHLLVRLGRADGAHDPLAHAGQDRLLARAADQPVDVGPHRHPRERQELDAVLGHGRHLGRGDDLGIDAHLHRLEDVAARRDRWRWPACR